MAFNRDYANALVLDFTGENEGGFYRISMTNAQGELNRRVMINRGEKFQVLSNLLDVAHGKIKEGGDDATLLIASFYFLPSRDKRFVEPHITWTFTSDDPAVEVSVERISPDGAWSLAPVKQARERNFVGRAGVGPAAGPISATVDGEFGMKQAMELTATRRSTAASGT
jgi:hypothetical protein